jgi:hypothetical protein
MFLDPTKVITQMSLLQLLWLTPNPDLGPYKTGRAPEQNPAQAQNPAHSPFFSLSKQKTTTNNLLYFLFFIMNVIYNNAQK